MDQGLRTKLEDIRERFEELGDMLCAPEINADKDKFLTLSREHADLRPVAEAFGAFLQLEGRLSETQELLSDPDMKELAEAELPDLRQQHSDMEVDLQKLLLPKDPNDSKNVILEIRAGTGGEEAALFAADLWRMYGRFAEREGWSLEPMSASEASAGGFKEVTGLIKGKDVYAKLKFESGVHRVQRVPATEAQGRIHTSAATVAIMPEAEEVDIEINEADIKFDKMRASGCGRAARQHHRLEGAAHPHPVRDRGGVAAGEVADQEPRDRDAAAAGAAARPGDPKGAGGAGGAPQVAGGQRGPIGEDPDVQLPAGSDHGSPDLDDPTQHRRVHGRRHRQHGRSAAGPRRGGQASGRLRRKG